MLGDKTSDYAIVIHSFVHTCGNYTFVVRGATFARALAFVRRVEEMHRCAQVENVFFVTRERGGVVREMTRTHEVSFEKGPDLA